MGRARDAAVGAARPTHQIGLHLRRDLPTGRQGNRPRPAILQYRHDEPHLAEISLRVAPGAHAVVLMDQAGWHLTPKLELPANISIIAIPSKCPELNPQENIWQFMRDNWLSNRVFNSYDDIVDHCCDAWNKLVDQPWKIMSIGLRNWAQEF